MKNENEFEYDKLENICNEIANDGFDLIKYHLIEAHDKHYENGVPIQSLVDIIFTILIQVNANSINNLKKSLLKSNCKIDLKNFIQLIKEFKFEEIEKMQPIRQKDFSEKLN